MRPAVHRDLRAVTGVAFVSGLVASLAGCGGKYLVGIEGADSDAGGGDRGVVVGGPPVDATTQISLPDAAGDVPQGAPFDSSTVPGGECSPTESILTCQPAASFAACWTCVKQVCSSQLAACAQDATCNAAIAGALNCVAEGGEISQCLPFAVMNGDDDTALAEVQGCTVVNNDACPCLTTLPANPFSAPSDVADADLPLCSCKTVPPYGNAMCMQSTSCQVPTCAVGGSPCCTPAGLCGCAPNIPGGPDLTCN
jgi:hypothetical protein